MKHDTQDNRVEVCFARGTLMLKQTQNAFQSSRMTHHTVVRKRTN